MHTGQTDHLRAIPHNAGNGFEAEERGGYLLLRIESDVPISREQLCSSLSFPDWPHHEVETDPTSYLHQCCEN